jgi:hypothetical protein
MSNVRFFKLSHRHAAEHLGDRPRDPRVTYTTGLARGKTYRPKKPAQPEAEPQIKVEDQ